MGLIYFSLAKFYPLVAAINFQLGCTSVISDLPIRAGTYFCTHLEASLYKVKEASSSSQADKPTETKTEELPWHEIGRSCFEIGKLVGNMGQKELGIKFLKIAINSLDAVRLSIIRNLAHHVLMHPHIIGRSSRRSQLIARTVRSKYISSCMIYCSACLLSLVM